VPGFTEVHLIEKDKDRYEHLKEMVGQYSNVKTYQGDCNAVIPNQVLRPDGMSQQAASFAFLDPPGLNLSWSTVVSLSQYRYDPRNHRKVELLILYPFDMAIDRQLALTTSAARLDEYYGGREWRDELSQSRVLGEDVTARRKRFVDLYVNKLKGLSYQYVVPFGPLGYKHRALYHFIFATDADPGDKIMKHVWDPKNPPFVEDEMGYKPVQRPLLELD
jgi:three-Cys-motif partner protein